MRSLVFVVALVVGSACERRAEPVEAVATPVPAKKTCAAVTGEALGRLPLTVTLGDEAISFAEWSVPDERSTQVVGFAAHLPGGVSFTVKAGDDEFVSNSPRWLHPRGVAGPRVHPVERITFCRTDAPQVVATR